MLFNSDLPSGWKLAKLSDLGEVNRGRSRHRPRHAPHLYGGPYPFIQTGDVKGSGGRITSYKQTYSEAGLAQSRLWPAGTMCITIAANIAETGILAFPACFPDSVIGFIPEASKCDVYFVEYVFRYIRRQIQHETADSGTVQDNINLGFLEDLRFPVPEDVGEQRAIARILSSLDDKIQLNLLMTQTLEAIAQAHFKSWFVDFDPVVAKTEGRKPFGMDAKTAALFPSSFQDSEVGPIPTGWSVGQMSRLVSQSRATLTPAAFPEELFLHYSIPAFDEGPRPRLELGAAIKSNKLLVPPGAILISKLNPETPRIWWPSETHQGRAICSTEFIVAVPVSAESTEYVYSIFKSNDFTDEFATLVTGTSSSHQRVKPDDFVQFPIVLPPEKCIETYCQLVSPLLTKASQAMAESATLASLRDTLLPGLVSGEFRIKQAERILEAV